MQIEKSIGRQPECPLLQEFGCTGQVSIVSKECAVVKNMWFVLVLSAISVLGAAAQEKMYSCVPLKFTNCYLLPVDDGFFLIDTGYDYEWDVFHRELGSLGIDMAQIKYLFITHAHDDHVGLVKQLIDSYPHIRVVCSQLTKEYLATGKHNNIDGAGYVNKRVGLVLRIKGKLHKKWTHTFPAVLMRESDLVFNGDVRLSELGINIGGKILSTPGHTLDSCSLILDNGDCFCGDAAANFLQTN